MTSPTEPPLVEIPPPDEYPDNVASFPGSKRATGLADDDLTAAERAILGGMLLSAQAISDVTQTALAPGDFYRPAHETIYRAILTVLDDGNPVDAISVADHLTIQGDLRRVGGVTYLHQLISATPVADNAGYYAQMVRERSILRQLAAAGARIQQLADIDRSGGDVDHLVAAALAEAQYVADLHADANLSTSSWQAIDITTLDLDATTETTILRRSDGIALVYPGANHGFVGESEGGKSWLALAACAEQIQLERHATFIDFEDHPGRVVRRLLELGCDRGQVEEFFRYLRPDVALTAAEGHHLIRAVEHSTVCVIDGVTEAMTMHGLSLSDNEDIAKFLHLLPRRIADLGPAVIQIDHVVKDEEARGRYALGGAHKLNGLDGAQYKIINTQPFGKGKRGHANVIVDKDREGWIRQHTQGIKIAEFYLDSTPMPDALDRPGPLRFELEPPDPGERTSAGEFRPTVLMKKIADHLWVIPGLTTNEVLDAIPGKKTTKVQALRQLVDEGYVRADPGPNRARVHTVIIPFEE